MVVAVVLVISLWVTIDILRKPEPAAVDTTEQIKLQEEIKDLKSELKARTEALERALIRADQFDSVSVAERKLRIQREAENLQLIEALKEKLRFTSNEDKRKMLIRRYEKANT